MESLGFASACFADVWGHLNLPTTAEDGVNPMGR
jgi:hypothetical protein